MDTNWLSDAPLGEWHGVTTDETGRVTELDLSGNALAGSFPGEIANLTGLRVLNLSDNGINGTVPAALSELTELEVLDLSGNELRSRVPSALTEIASLRILDLSDNKLTGTGGLTWLGEFETLEEVDLSQNRIEAPHPRVIGRRQQPDAARPESEPVDGSDSRGTRRVDAAGGIAARRELALGIDSA